MYKKVTFVHVSHVLGSFRFAKEKPRIWSGSSSFGPRLLAHFWGVSNAKNHRWPWFLEEKTRCATFCLSSHQGRRSPKFVDCHSHCCSWSFSFEVSVSHGRWMISTSNVVWLTTSETSNSHQQRYFPERSGFDQNKTFQQVGSVSFLWSKKLSVISSLCLGFLSFKHKTSCLIKTSVTGRFPSKKSARFASLMETILLSYLIIKAFPAHEAGEICLLRCHWVFGPQSRTWYKTKQKTTCLGTFFVCDPKK